MDNNNLFIIQKSYIHSSHFLQQSDCQSFLAQLGGDAPVTRFASYGRPNMMSNMMQQQMMPSYGMFCL
jgi:hypothetical protein